MISRRKFLTHVTAPAGLAVASYALAIEPDFLLQVVTLREKKRTKGLTPANKR